MTASPPLPSYPAPRALGPFGGGTHHGSNRSHGPLRRPKVPRIYSNPKNKIRVNGDALTEFVAACFRHNGMPATDAMMSAKGIVLADLVGHESHGVSNNLAGFYLPDLESGVINPHPNMRITRESPSTATWEADHAMGFVIAIPGDGGRHRARLEGRFGLGGGGQLAPLRDGPDLQPHGARPRHDRVLDDERRHPGGRAVRRSRSQAQHEPDLRRDPRRRGAAVRARHRDDHRRVRQDRQLRARGQVDPADLGSRPRRPSDHGSGRSEGRGEAADVRRDARRRRAQGLRPGCLGRHHVRRAVGLGLHRQAGRGGERQPLLRRLERRQLRADRAPQGADGRARCAT